MIGQQQKSLSVKCRHSPQCRRFEITPECLLDQRNFIIIHWKIPSSSRKTAMLGISCSRFQDLAMTSRFLLLRPPTSNAHLGTPSTFELVSSTKVVSDDVFAIPVFADEKLKIFVMSVKTLRGAEANPRRTTTTGYQ